MSVYHSSVNRTFAMHDTSQSGFTLIEILLVLTLIAVSISMIAPSFISGTGVDLDEEARRLQQVLRLAAEEAQLTGVPIRLTALKSGYHFEKLGAENRWNSFSETPFNAYKLPQGAEITAINFSGGFSSTRKLKEKNDEADQGEVEIEADEKEKGRIGHLIFWPDGMLDAADMVIANPELNKTKALQLRSGPGGIRVIEEDQSES